MLKKARIVVKIVLASSVVVTASLTVADIVLCCLDMSRQHRRHH